LDLDDLLEAGNAHRVVLAVGCLCLAVIAALQERRGLSPPSMWFDDLWVADLIRCATWSDIFRLAPPVPVGYLGMEKLVTAIFGFGHLPLQSVAALARILAIPVLALAASALTRRTSVGLATGALLAMNSELACHSVRPKQYALDVFIAALLVLLAVSFFMRPARRRFVRLWIAAVIALPFSFGSAFIGPALTHLAAILLLKEKPDRRFALIALAVLDLALAGMWLLWRRQATPGIASYWAPGYMNLHDLKGAWNFVVAGSGRDLMADAFASVRYLPWLFPVGIVALFFRRESRLLGIFAIALVIEVLGASALGKYPLASGRLGCFTFPAILTTAAAGLALLLRRVPLLPLAAAAALLVFVGRQAIQEPSGRYADAGELFHVRRAAEIAKPDDIFIFSQGGGYAAAFYGPWPVEMRASPKSANGFDTLPKAPGAVVLSEDIEKDVAAAIPSQAHRVIFLASQNEDWWCDRVANQQRDANRASRLFICEKP
jgi:hypothetical protein